MLKLRFAASMIPVGIMAMGAGLVFSQSFPSKPIRIVTQQAGGGGDFASRLIGQAITGPLGQPVIVENRPSNLIGEIVAKAEPDGYTLLHAGSGFMFTPLLRKAPYDAVRDFSPVTTTTKAPTVLIVPPTLPAKSVKELIALAKAKPGALNYAATTPGGGLHIGGELFKSMAGVNLVGINYKGSSAALNGLMAGEVQVMFAEVTSAAPLAKAGKLRSLAVTSPEPSILYPGLPTVAASVPGFELVGIDAIWAPARTPAAIIKRLNQEIVRALNQPDIKEKFFDTGVETVGGSPEQLAAAMKRAIATTAKVIKDAGIKVEQ